MNTSMHRRAFAPVRGPCHTCAFGEQRIEDIKHRLLAWLDKGPARDLFGVPQKLFRFSQFFHTASLPRGVFRGIPFIWNSHDPH